MPTGANQQMTSLKSTWSASTEEEWAATVDVLIAQIISRPGWALTVSHRDGRHRVIFVNWPMQSRPSASYRSHTDDSHRCTIGSGAVFRPGSAPAAEKRTRRRHGRARPRRTRPGSGSAASVAGVSARVREF